MNILVLFGGCSHEHEISMLSAATIIANMTEERYKVVPVYITREGKWLLYDGFLDNIKNILWEKFGTPVVLSPDRINRGLLRIVGERVKTVPVDAAFPVMHGQLGGDGTLQGLLEISGIPYVGSGVLASAVAMDKAITKQIAQNLGVQQADYFVVDGSTGQDELTKKMRYKIGYPCFVKPANGSSSIGITKVKAKKDLDDALTEAFEIDSKVLIEKAVTGRELQCAVIGDGCSCDVSVIGEVVPSAEFYNFESRYRGKKNKAFVPAEISDDIAEEIKKQAVRIFNGLNCKGVATVDFFLENDTNRIVFNEINTMPEFTSQSLCPILLSESGIEIPALIDKLIEIAVR